MQVKLPHCSSPMCCNEQLAETGVIPRAKDVLAQKDSLFNSAVGGKIVRVETGERIFSQGDPANAVFYIFKGCVKLTVLSTNGKEAIIAPLCPGDFIGEECVMGVLPQRISAAIAVSPCTLLRFEKKEMERMLHEKKKLFDEFLAFLLSRGEQLQDGLIDQLFNSSEKRLARELLVLAGCGRQDSQERMVPDISQETLAEIIGTTRPHVNRILNKFKKLGFIEYCGRQQGMQINNSLRSVLQEV
jgi:CRP/FNR family cyclic AMP-dependent transcriptional regulator